ncbi:MAG: hypothetical protein ABIP39_13710 [Polyangiaceae bacterium]
MSDAVEQATLLILEIEQAQVTAALLPLPNARDELCEPLTKIYAAASEAERAEVRAAGTEEQLRLLLPFADRMAILAVRSKDDARITSGLIAHAVEDFRWDARENLRSLSLLFRSGEKLGIDAAARFREAARLASPSSRKYFVDFADDPKSPEVMGFREVDGPDGFTYESEW